MSKIEEIVEPVEATVPATKTGEIPEGAAVSVYSRAEKKSRKGLEKLGLKKVEGISRVTFRRGPNTIYVIAQPEVFKSPSSNSYIVFGEVKIEDLSAASRAQSALAASAKESAEDSAPASKDQASILADLEAAAASVSLEEEPVLPEATPEARAAAGLTQDDFELIQEQTSASPEKILAAFEKNDKDVINTIVSLTS